MFVNTGTVDNITSSKMRPLGFKPLTLSNLGKVAWSLFYTQIFSSTKGGHKSILA